MSFNETNWNFYEIDSNTTTFQYTALTYSKKLKAFCVMRNDNFSKKCYLSYDGKEWLTTATQPNPPLEEGEPINGKFRGLTWSEELEIFCAVDENSNNNPGRVIISSDAYTWEEINTDFIGLWSDVVWSKELGLFCAVDRSSNGKIMTSFDGKNWIVRYQSNVSLYCVTWIPELNKLIAGSTTSKVLISSNGTDWQEIDIGFNFYFRGFAYNNRLNRICSVSSGNSNSQRIIISDDGGNTWQLISNEFTDDKVYFDITFSKELGVFCAVNRDIIFSEDGINWRIVYELPGSSQLLKVEWSSDIGVFTSVSFNTERGAYTSDKYIPPLLTSPNNNIYEKIKKDLFYQNSHKEKNNFLDKISQRSYNNIEKKKFLNKNTSYSELLLRNKLIQYNKYKNL